MVGWRLPRMARWSAAGAILTIAAGVRLLWPDLVSITNDEGAHGIHAMNIAVLDHWPWVGLPSVGIRNSAAFMYLLAIPYAVCWHPLAGVVFVALLNVVAVGLLMHLARVWFGPWSALWSGALAATAPWMVLYSRNMWPPSCLAIFSLMLLSWGLRWLEEGGSRRLFGLAAGALLLPAMHFSGLAGTVWVGIVLIQGARRIAVLPLLAGLLAGSVIWAPWLYWQHFANHWADLDSITALSRGKLSPLDATLMAGNCASQLVGADGFEYWFGTRPSDMPQFFPRPVVSAALVAGWVLGALTLTSVLWALASRERAATLLAVWVLIPFALLALARPEVHPHYLLVAFPVPYLLVAAFLERVARGRVGRWLISLAVVVIAGIHLAFLGGCYRLLEAEENRGGHFELSYRQRKHVIDHLLDAVPDRRIVLAGYFSGQAPAYDLIYHHERIRRGTIDRPEDNSRRFWVDERLDDQPPPGPEWQTERYWRVGATRVFQQRLIGAP